jgi:hypothetical protein
MVASSTVGKPNRVVNLITGFNATERRFSSGQGQRR